MNKKKSILLIIGGMALSFAGSVIFADGIKDIVNKLTEKKDVKK